MRVALARGIIGLRNPRATAAFQRHAPPKSRAGQARHDVPAKRMRRLSLPHVVPQPFRGKRHRIIPLSRFQQGRTDHHAHDIFFTLANGARRVELVGNEHIVRLPHERSIDIDVRIGVDALKAQNPLPRFARFRNAKRPFIGPHIGFIFAIAIQVLIIKRIWFYPCLHQRQLRFARHACGNGWPLLDGRHGLFLRMVIQLPFSIQRKLHSHHLPHHHTAIYGKWQ